MGLSKVGAECFHVHLVGLEFVFILFEASNRTFLAVLPHSVASFLLLSSKMSRGMMNHP